MVFHNTTNIVLDFPEITKACFEWCSDQYFIYNTNTEIRSLTILIIALISLFIYFLANNFLDYFTRNISFESKEKIEKFILLLPDFAMYLIIGFFIYFIYFSG